MLAHISNSILPDGAVCATLAVGGICAGEGWQNAEGWIARGQRGGAEMAAES